MCSIFLSLVAIMFESGQFYELEESTGTLKLSTDPTTVSFYTIVLVMGAIALIGSIVYYLTVLLSEMLGCIPKWLRVLCAHKLSAIKRRNLSEDDDSRFSFDDGVFEMAPVENTAFANPLQDLEEARKANSEALEKHQRLLKTQAEMLEKMRVLKKKSVTEKAVKLTRRSRASTKKIRRNFEPQKAGVAARTEN